jgi:hypothetical protein
MPSLPGRQRALQQRSRASTAGPPASPNTHSVQSWKTELPPRNSLYSLGGACGSRTNGGDGGRDEDCTLPILLTLACLPVYEVARGGTYGRGGTWWTLPTPACVADDDAAAPERGGTGIDLDLDPSDDGRTDAAGSTQNPGTHTGAGGVDADDLSILSRRSEIDRTTSAFAPTRAKYSLRD